MFEFIRLHFTGLSKRNYVKPFLSFFHTYFETLFALTIYIHYRISLSRVERRKQIRIFKSVIEKFFLIIKVCLNDRIVNLCSVTYSCDNRSFGFDHFPEFVSAP